jgi:hypothetical protein
VEQYTPHPRLGACRAWADGDSRAGSLRPPHGTALPRAPAPVPPAAWTTAWAPVARANAPLEAPKGGASSLRSAQTKARSAPSSPRAVAHSAPSPDDGRSSIAIGERPGASSPAATKTGAPACGVHPAPVPVPSGSRRAERERGRPGRSLRGRRTARWSRRERSRSRSALPRPAPAAQRRRSPESRGNDATQLVPVPPPRPPPQLDGLPEGLVPEC